MSTQTRERCHHCGDVCPEKPLENDAHVFCCDGCVTVYNILKSNNLTTYYELAQHPGTTRKNARKTDRFASLDTPEIAQSIYQFYDQQVARVQFKIPAIHCASCVWLLEQLPAFEPGILRAEVDLMRKQLSVVFNPTRITLRAVVELMDTLGYTPEIEKKGTSQSASQHQNRMFLYRLGVAGFCFGNSMLFSFPEYLAGDEVIDTELRLVFGWLNLALAIPVLFFSSAGYFKSAFQGLKRKVVTIDVPLALGILVMFIRSAAEIITDSGPGFMDAMIGLVFFLLVGKWYQQKTYDAFSFERDYTSYFPLSVQKIMSDGTLQNTPLAHLQPGDLIELKDQDLVPADAILEQGESLMDYSFVTGEAVPLEKKKGDKIFAGGRHQGHVARLRLLQTVSQSYLTQLWNQSIFSRAKSPELDSRVHTVSKYFTLAVLIIASFTGIYWYFTDASLIWNAVTAVLIITCPCALALTLPFTLGNVVRIFGRNNIYLKNAPIIEPMAKLDTLVFDKTGTITALNQHSVQWQGTPLNTQETEALRTVFKASSHPLSKAISSYLNQAGTKPADYWEQVAGQGIKALIGGVWYKAGSAAFVGLTTTDAADFNASVVYVSIDDVIYGRFYIKNEYRPGIREVLNTLTDTYEVHILSGDHDGEAETLRTWLGPKAKLQFEQTPVQKLQYIQELQAQGKKVGMFGDGLNDAGALQQADVGIAVTDDVNHFFPASDALLPAAELPRLPAILQLTHDALRVSKLSFIISFTYNIIGLSFAVRGALDPVVAAVLMPISSVSIIVFTTLLTRFYGSKRKFDV